jgi:hypothetical protein
MKKSLHGDGSGRVIFPRDIGHRAKDHIMIRKEVIDGKAT